MSSNFDARLQRALKKDARYQDLRGQMERLQVLIERQRTRFKRASRWYFKLNDQLRRAATRAAKRELELEQSLEGLSNGE